MKERRSNRAKIRLFLSFIAALGLAFSSIATLAGQGPSRSAVDEIAEGLSDVKEVAQQASQPGVTKKHSFYIPYEKVENHEFVPLNGQIYFFRLGSVVTRYSQNEDIKDMVRIVDEFASPFIGLLGVSAFGVMFNDLLQKSFPEFIAGLGMGLIAKMVLKGWAVVREKMLWQGADNPFYTIVNNKFYHLVVEKPTVEQMILEQALLRFRYLNAQDFNQLLDNGQVASVQPLFPKKDVGRQIGVNFKHTVAFCLELVVDTAFWTFGLPNVAGSGFFATILARMGFEQISAAVTRLYYNAANKLAPRYEKGETEPKKGVPFGIAFHKGVYHYIYTKE